MRDPVEREFLLAFWKVHILHHAGEQGVYGQWMLEELRHHGYRLSPGTLYPILSRMAARGWLRVEKPTRPHGPRVYRLTPKGRAVLNRVLDALGELIGEVGARHSPSG
jgi:PadR family transcriptional regulator PadR